jgi:hypothetical protein
MIDYELLEEAARKHHEFIEAQELADDSVLDESSAGQMETAMSSIGIDVKSIVEWAESEVPGLFEAVEQAVNAGALQPGGGRIWKALGTTAFIQGILIGVWAQRLRNAAEVGDDNE